MKNAGVEIFGKTSVMLRMLRLDPKANVHRSESLVSGDYSRLFCGVCLRDGSIRGPNKV